MTRTVYCQRCHAPNEAPVRFCSNCGYDVRRAAAVQVAAALVGVACSMGILLVFLYLLGLL